MKKYWMFISILFMTVGFATVSTTLSLNGDISVYNTLEDFDVYFSDIRVNNVKDWSPVEDSNVLSFTPDLSNGDYVLEYDITNSSKNYDADVKVTCTSNNSNILITNEFDNSTSLEAHETRSGKVTIKDFYVGQEIVIFDNYFNVIENDDTVSLLSLYSLDSNYRQNKDSYSKVAFSTSDGWEYYPGPKEIDIKTWSPSIYTYIDNYATYLKNETGDSSLTVDLITLSQLSNLGCTINDDYSYVDGLNCANSSYKKWLISTYHWWTRSAASLEWHSNQIWFVSSDSNLYTSYNYDVDRTVRPVVNISKNVLSDSDITCTIEAIPLENDVLGEEDVPNAVEKCEWVYTDSDSSGSITVGDEYAYCNEKFNVIDSSGENVKLLTKYYLGKNYKQSITFNPVLFSNSSGWEYYPGPKEIDLNTWSPNITTYINNYVKYLKDITGDSNISGDLITASQLVDLGCTINPDYSFSSDSNCLNSKHNSWLLIGQSWWTKSAYGYADLVIILYSAGVFGADNPTRNDVVVRPVITISKSTLNNT